MSNNIDWKVIDTYFSSFKYYISKHHLESYNYFVKNSIPYIIKTLNPFTTLKNDQTTNNLKHEINVYIGGKSGDNIYINKPFIYDNEATRVLFPNEARLKDYNYISELAVDILVEFIYHDKLDKKGNPEKCEKIFEKIKIGSIPIMLHSDICVLNNQKNNVLQEMGECPFDQGGYFIISGKEKVLLSQERTTTNRLFVTKSKDEKYSLEAVIRCTSDKNNLFPKTINFGILNDNVRIKCNSIYENEIFIDKTDGKEKKRKRSCRANAIVLTSPNIDTIIPLFVMFRALGIESDKSILEHIVGNIDDINNSSLLIFLRHSLIDGSMFYKQSECLEYLSHYTKYSDPDYIRYILTNDFLPNVGTDFKSKALFLGYLVKNLVKTKLGLLNESNRDNYIHKRIDLSGRLLTNIFRDFYNQLRNNIRGNIDSIYNYQSFANHGDIKNIINNNNLKKIFDHEFIEKGMINSLKGQWGVEKKPEDSGIPQDLGRLSYLDYVSHVRRINTPMDRALKLVEPHRLSASQFGYMCPMESPDGANIGLLKHLALLCNISKETDKTIIENKLIELNVILLKHIYPTDINKYCKVFINNNWFGVTHAPDEIVKNFKKYRGSGEINYDISISWNIKENEINILCDAGRCIRPLYKVKKNKVLIDDYDLTKHTTWNDLIIAPNGKNFIEFIDVQETNTILIAMTRDNLNNTIQPYTHCEIHPSTALSIYTNTIPFCNRNQAPRNVFSGQQGKQSIGVYATNFNSRIDTASYILHYPQKALVHTRYTRYSHNDELPNGQNVIVAIMTYTGYNQEDSIMINKNSIERGLFNITSFKAIVDEETENLQTGEKIFFANPVNMKKNAVNIEYKYANWDTIDEHGMPKINTYVHEGDVILGKVKVDSILQEDNDPFSSKIKFDEYKDKSLLSSKILYGTIDKVFAYKNKDGQKKVKIKIRKMRQPVLGDKLACYSDDTELLTTDGWILFKNLTKEHKVATLVNNKLIYQNPIELQSYDFSGKMYEVNSNQVKLLVTDNHRMYVRTRASNYKMEEAKNIFNKLRHYKKNCDIWEPDLTNAPTELKIENGIITKFIIPSCLYNKKQYPSLELDINAWLTFYGIWLAEGCFIRDFGISIASHKQRVKDELEIISTIMHFNIHKHKDKKNDEIKNAWVYSDEKQLVKYMLQFRKTAPFKYMPKWVWYLSREQCKVLINGMMLGDGHTMDNGTRRYDTSSAQLADDFQRLCLHAGWSCNKILKYEAGHSSNNTVNDKVITSNYDAWRLTIIESQNEPIVNKYRSDGHKFDKLINYAGKVYCCTVSQGEGILYVRRNYYPVWSGNSQHGQKGVCGLILNQEDMPFTKDGIIPDIIINPHAIPSRMTIAHLVESVLSKLCCLEGFNINSTAFENHNINGYYDILSKKFGYDKYGNELLYNGFSGQQIESEIFIGPTYYYRIKHMVQDKMNYRDKGPITAISHQPVKGRAHEGALRIGEMETNALLSHGIASFTKESLMERSDKEKFGIDVTTGHFAYYNKKLNTLLSTEDENKDTTDDYSYVETPYAFKLLTQELEGMAVSLKLITDPKEINDIIEKEDAPVDDMNESEAGSDNERDDDNDDIDS